MKFWRLHNIINIVGGIVCILLTVLIFVLQEHKVLIGVLFRGVISILILYNSLYLLFTNKPSFIARNIVVKDRRLAGILLFAVGMLGLVTAIMGYGINGFPLLDWSTVF
ncbi:MAG: hypothetical protein ACOZCL_12455 [Bacillota bacterium]